jgi:hypothetical protein
MTMTDLDTALAAAKRPERSVPICLRGDLHAEFEDLERQLHEVQQEPGERRDRKGEARGIGEQIQSLRDEMSTATVALRLRGLNHGEYARLLAEHKPRHGEAEDQAAGYNFESFFPALVAACLCDVTAEQWSVLYEALSAGQYSALVDAAVAVSTRQVQVPRSFVAELAVRDA